MLLKDVVGVGAHTICGGVSKVDDHHGSTVYRLVVDVDIWPLNELNMLPEAKPGFPRHPRVTHNDIIHKSDAKNIF